MKNKTLLFFMLLTLLMPWTAKGQETVTVCDGTAAGTTTSINGTIPIDGVHVNLQGNTSEFIIPATTEHMDELVGGTINKLTFYINSTNPTSWGSPTVQFYMGEVEETTLSNVHNPNNFTIVATVEGLSNQSAEMEVTLTTPYTYRGGNLLIGTYVQTASSVWVWTGFNGIEAPANSSRRRYLTYGTGDGAAFLPKTTFTFEPANDCPRPTSLVASNVTTHTATMTWTIVDESYNAQFNLEYKKTTDDTWTRYGLGNTRSFTLTGLDDNSEYQVRIQTVCGSDDEDNSIWKYASNFTTPIACPAPTNHAVTESSITANEATVTWTGTSSDGYVVMIGETATSIGTVDFENQTIPSDWTNDATYPWVITNAAAGSGTYSMKSGNNGINNSTSSIIVTVTYVQNGTIEFDARCSSEQTSTSYDWDYGTFYIDGVQQGDRIINSETFTHYSYEVEAGPHTFLWKYKKDGSTSTNDDCFYVDNVTMPITSVPSWTEYTTNNQTYTFASLTPNTSYQVKVKGNCGSEGYSVETTPVRFTTLPTCFPPTNVHFAEGPTTHSVTVAWDFEEGELVQIGMFHGYFTDPSEIQTSSLDTPEGSSSATWNNLFADYDYTFAIRKYCSETDQSEVVVMPFHTPETCTTPTNLTVVENSVSGHGATITWDVNGEFNYWNIEFATDEDFVNVLYVDYEGNPPFTFTQIQSETTYYVRVKANCVPSGNGESHYSNVISFTTLASCPAPYDLAVDNLTYESATLNWTGFGDSYDLSYRTAGYLDVVGIEEPFATSNFTPTGWARYSGALNSDGTATLSSSYSWGFVTRNFSSIHAYVNLYSYQKLWLVTPSFTVGSNYSLNFDAAYTAYNSTNPPDLTGTDDRFLVLISTDNKEHWTILREWNNAGTGDAVLNDLPVTFQPVDEIDLSAYAGQTVYIAFYVASTVYNASNDLHIDNVAIGHHIAAGEWQTATTATTTYDFSGLVYDTPYEVHVQSDCGSSYGTSDPSEAITFTTLSPPPCDIAENFAKVSESETHQGATFTWDDDGDDYTVMVGPMHFTSHFNCFFEGETIPDAFTHTGDYGFEKAVFEGSDCAKSVNAGISNSTADMVLQITLPIEATLGFNAKVSSEATYDKAYFSIDGAVQDNLNGISGEGAWYHYDYTLSAGTHTLRWYYVKDNSENVNDDCFYVSTITIGSYIVDNWTSFVHATSPFTVTGLPSNTEYFAKVIRNCTTGIQSNDSYVAWFKTLPCQSPTGIELVVSPISFLCRWDAQIGDVFQYCVLPEGYPLQESYFGTYELLNEPINGKYETAQSVYSDSDYIFYLRKKCGENDFSETVTLSFHTKLAPITVDEDHPFTDDFEGNLEWDLASGSQNNHWMQGSDENLDCNGNALFIANADNYGYYDEATTSYAFRTFYLTPGTYTYSYDWRSYGEENYDYLRVVLVRYLNDITATTLSSNFYEAMPWDQWTPIDGGSQLILSNEWSTKAGVVNITNEDYYQVAFIWRNDDDTNEPYPAAIDNFRLTKAQVVANQWDDDFEGSNRGWMLINGDRPNQWVWGNAAGNPGASLYISNDGGTTNAYTDDEGYGSTVYAVKPLNFENTRYHFSYDYRVAGEVNFDYLRVALVPATVTLEASTVLPINNFIDHLPEGWIALDGGSQLSANSSNPSWLSKTVIVDIPTAGNYYVVLAWRNDYSGGYQTPAAVDNFTIIRDLCPYDAGNLYADNVTTNSAWIYWTGDAPVWEIAYSTNQFSEYQSIFIGGNPEGNVYTLEGLDFGTEYQVKVRAFCDEDHQGFWCDSIHFTTDCIEYSVPFAEDFDSYAPRLPNNLPRCWNYINTCSVSTYKNYPTINDENSHSSANSLKFTSYVSYNSNQTISGDPQPQYAILPAVQNVSDLKLSLWAKAWRTNSTIYDASFKVGVMTDPTDASTFTEVATFGDPENVYYHQHTVDFSSYTGNGTYIAIMIEPATTMTNDGTHSTYNRIVFIDDVRVFSRYPVPVDLAASHITATSAHLTWSPGGDETIWQVAYKKTSDTDWTESFDFDQNYYTLSGLDTNTEYEVKVRAKIGDDYYNWTEPISFTTSYPTPFFEPFNIAELPADWGNYYVLADQIWAGTATLGGYGSWSFYNTYVFGEHHARLNIWGGYSANPTCSWLVTPNIYVEDDQFLSFDMALTSWDSANPHNNTCDDDKFIVMASTDDGATWTELRKWDNAWYQHDYVFNDIPADGEKVYINLASYAGQSVRFAFYGESTESGNGDNDLHIDNVRVAYEPPCDMVDYFDVVSGSETPEGATFEWDDNGDDFTVMVGGPVSFTNLFICDFIEEELPSELSHTGDYGFVKAIDGNRTCAKSDNGGFDNTTADMILEITNTEEADLSFSARVSSEENYDKAYFSIDGVVQDNLNGISGEGEWLAYSYTLPAGTHTLRWYYNKDYSEYGYDDCFYVSDIIINSYNWTSYEHATSPFTVTGLSPETDYWAKVVRNCHTGEHSVDSYVASFQTTDPCQKPKNLETYTGPYSAHLYWDYGYQEEEWRIIWLNMTHQDQYGSITIYASQLSDPSQPEYFINGLESNTDFIVAIEVPCDGTYTGEYEHQLVGNFTTAGQYSTQATELIQGWNWWAPTVTQMTWDDMEDELDPKLSHVIGQDGELGSDDEFIPGQMYRVEVTEDCEFYFYGETATNEDVNIAPGYNWLGYFGAEKTVTRVFLGFTPAVGDKIISQDEGFAIYNGTSWEGTLETLKPGQGYVYISNATTTKTLHIE